MRRINNTNVITEHNSNYRNRNLKGIFYICHKSYIHINSDVTSLSGISNHVKNTPLNKDIYYASK